MDTVSVAINLPVASFLPEHFQAAIHQAIDAQIAAGNSIAAAALGNLLSMIHGSPRGRYNADWDHRTVNTPISFFTERR